MRTCAGSVDDLDEDPPSLSRATGLHDRAQRLDRASLAADHLPTVRLGDAQLEHDGLVVLDVLVHLHLVRLVDQGPGQELEQLLQPLIPLAFKSFLTVPEGCAPWASHLRVRSSSITIVDGSVWGL